MSNELPRRGSSLPPRRHGEAEGKTQAEVIGEAALKTNAAEQTNPIEDQKPWLKGSNLTEAELMNLTNKKSFNFPLLVQAGLDFTLELQKKKSRGFGLARLTETSLVIKYVIKGIRADLKKEGYNFDIDVD